MAIYQVARDFETHTIKEALIKSCMINIARELLDEKYVNIVCNIYFQNNSVVQWISNMADNMKCVTSDVLNLFYKWLNRITSLDCRVYRYVSVRLHMKLSGVTSFFTEHNMQHTSWLNYLIFWLNSFSYEISWDIRVDICIDDAKKRMSYNSSSLYQN